MSGLRIGSQLMDGLSTGHCPPEGKGKGKMAFGEVIQLKTVGQVLVLSILINIC